MQIVEVVSVYLKTAEFERFHSKWMLRDDANTWYSIVEISDFQYTSFLSIQRAQSMCSWK